MPRTKRDKLKREAAQAIYHIYVAKHSLKTLWEQFEPAHKDEAASLVVIAQGLDAMVDSIKKWWEWCWGKPPDHIDGYRL